MLMYTITGQRPVPQPFHAEKTITLKNAIILHGLPYVVWVAQSPPIHCLSHVYFSKMLEINVPGVASGMYTSAGEIITLTWKYLPPFLLGTALKNELLSMRASSSFNPFKSSVQ